MIARRTFLASLGASAALAPLVPLLNSTAQEGAMPRRLVLFFTPDGLPDTNWIPAGTGSSFSFSNYLTPLNAIKDDVLLLSGIDIRSGGPGGQHPKGAASIWTASSLGSGTAFADGNGRPIGWGQGTSVDQYIVQNQATETPFPSLEFAVQTLDKHPQSRTIYRGADQPVDPDQNPYSAFDRIFGGIASAGTVDPVREARRSVLDLVGGELCQLQSQIGVEERQKLEAHVEAVRGIERRLTPMEGEATCSVPTVGAVLDHNAQANYGRIGELQQDLLASALTCDLTRIASLQYSRAISPIKFSWLGLDKGHHNYSHSGGRAEVVSINTWYAEQFVRFIELLKSIPEGDGSLLDNTLVIWGREMASMTHSTRNMPLVIAGRCGGAVRPGRHLSYNRPGHHRVLVTACQAMGLSGVTAFGDRDDGGGPFTDWT
ncbi:MAG: DUF1552 domain-containing protein [Myxococcota bacterium]